jgi:hypothetical protein
MGQAPVFAGQALSSSGEFGGQLDSLGPSLGMAPRSRPNQVGPFAVSRTDGSGAHNRRRSAAADDLEGCCAAHGRHLSTSATDAVGRRTGNTDNKKSHLEVLREDEDQYVCGALDQQCLATRKSHVSSSCRTL